MIRKSKPSFQGYRFEIFFLLSKMDFEVIGDAQWAELRVSAILGSQTYRKRLDGKIVIHAVCLLSQRGERQASIQSRQ